MWAEIVLFAAVIVILYTYFGYPLLVYILGKLQHDKQEPEANWTPAVSLIIAARNEAQCIAEKLENALQLDYPSEKLEIIVSSDASEDSTVEIVRQFASRGVQVVDLEQRGGKTAAQNAAVQRSSGEVLVFSDATTLYRSDALRQLLAAFNHQGSVGCVAGHLTYKGNGIDKYEEQHYYWNWEASLRLLESRIGFIPGVAGCIYAVRRDAFVLLPPDAISDFLQPLEIGYRGRRVCYQPLAVALEQRSPDLIVDFRRRRRTIARALHGLGRNPHFLNPFKNKFRAVQIWSHKVLRWFSPCFFLAILVALQFLHNSSLTILSLVLFSAILLSGVLGILTRNKSAGRWLRLSAYFLLASLASLLAIWDWLRGQHYITWEPQR